MSIGKEIKNIYNKDPEFALEVANILGYEVKKIPVLEKLAVALEDKGFLEEASKVREVISKGWGSLPKGWTKESVNKFWGSLIGDRKHKITQCMKKMKGKVSDEGAFCASIADMVDYEPKLKPGQKGPWGLKD